MEQTLKDFLINYRESHGLTQQEMAHRLGISPRMYFDYEKGAFVGKAKKLAEFKAKLASNVQETIHAGVPVYDVQATAGDGMKFAGELPEKILGYIHLPAFAKCVAFVFNRGDSMYPKLKAGDMIGLIPVSDMDIIEYGQVFLIVTQDDQRLVKYIRRGNDDEHLILRSENEKYDDINIHKSKILKLYKVQGPVRADVN
jgi:DNA-binding XRE family transcriptional regulator